MADADEEGAGGRQTVWQQLVELVAVAGGVSGDWMRWYGRLYVIGSNSRRCFRRRWKPGRSAVRTRTVSKTGLEEELGTRLEWP
jgi:hypothetical protein